MQDSISGPDHNLMPKFFRIYNPYTLTPAITYFPLSLFTPVASASNDFRTQADIAYFNNISDSLIFVISAYPGFNSNVYLTKQQAMQMYIRIIQMFLQHIRRR
ncbi:MAG: hypothetical protein IPH77_15765 [Ignavibacteria bacterium]|nr:hypothetical protein [Ignavibacteria bacterium]